MQLLTQRVNEVEAENHSLRSLLLEARSPGTAVSLGHQHEGGSHMADDSGRMQQSSDDMSIMSELASLGSGDDRIDARQEAIPHH